MGRGMKKLILTQALLLVVLFGREAEAQQSVVVPATTASVPVVGTVAAATILVAGVAGKSIYVTSIGLVPVATAVVTLTQGTGAGCGTGTTNVTGAMTFAAGQVLTLGDGYGAIWALVQGNSLCITIATAAAPGSLSYSLF
jgi:hypothetical protein